MLRLDLQDDAGGGRPPSPVQARPSYAGDTIELDAHHADAVWSRLGHLVADGRPVDALPADPTETAAGLAGALPVPLLRAIHRLRNRGDALLVRNLVPRHVDIEPTPVEDKPPAEATGLARLCLLGIAWLLGEPFTFSSLCRGQVVQNVLPLPGQEQGQTNASSGSFLDWHVEDAFSEDRCDYFALLCLRGDPAARTMFSAVSDIVLDAASLDVLRQPRFVVRPDVAHGELAVPLQPTPVLTGPPADPEVRYDSVYMYPYDEQDQAAAVALGRFKAGVLRASVGHELKRGDLLIIDNNRVLHGRTPFRARFDGTDRWLMRVMICSSIPRHRRRGSSRAITAGAT